MLPIVHMQPARIELSSASAVRATVFVRVLFAASGLGSERQPARECPSGDDAEVSDVAVSVPEGPEAITACRSRER